MRLSTDSKVGPWRVIEHVTLARHRATYMVTNADTKQCAALDVYDAPPRAFGSYTERLRTAMHRLNRVGHPGVVEIFDVGTLADGRPYVVREWIDGIALGSCVTASPLSTAETVELCLAICDVLNKAHARGVLHRALELDNVVIAGRRTDTLVVKLLDWGMTEELLSVVRPGTTAPPLVPATAADDVHALGVLMHRLLARVPLAIEPLWTTMLAQDPSARPSIEEVAARLRAIDCASDPEVATSPRLPVEPPSAPRVLIPRTTTGSLLVPPIAAESDSEISAQPSLARRRTSGPWPTAAIEPREVAAPHIRLVPAATTGATDTPSIAAETAPPTAAQKPRAPRATTGAFRVPSIAPVNVPGPAALIARAPRPTTGSFRVPETESATGAQVTRAPRPTTGAFRVPALALAPGSAAAPGKTAPRPTGTFRVPTILPVSGLQSARQKTPASRRAPGAWPTSTIPPASEPQAADPAKQSPPDCETEGEMAPGRVTPPPPARARSTPPPPPMPRSARASTILPPVEPSPPEELVTSSELATASDLATASIEAAIEAALATEAGALDDAAAGGADEEDGPPWVVEPASESPTARHAALAARRKMASGGGTAIELQQSAHGQTRQLAGKWRVAMGALATIAAASAVFVASGTMDSARMSAAMAQEARAAARAALEQSGPPAAAQGTSAREAVSQGEAAQQDDAAARSSSTLPAEAPAEQQLHDATDHGAPAAESRADDREASAEREKSHRGAVRRAARAAQSQTGAASAEASEQVGAAQIGGRPASGARGGDGQGAASEPGPAARQPITTVLAVARTAEPPESAEAGSARDGATESQEKAALVHQHQRVGHRLLEFERAFGTEGAQQIAERFRWIKLEAALATGTSRRLVAATLTELQTKLERAIDAACADAPEANVCR